MANVPLEKASISKTPIGPFQMIVLAFPSASEKSFTLAGPMSSARHPTGISCEVTILVSAPWSRECAMTQSTGR